MYGQRCHSSKQALRNLPGFDFAGLLINLFYRNPQTAGNAARGFTCLTELDVI